MRVKGSCFSRLPRELQWFRNLRLFAFSGKFHKFWNLYPLINFQKIKVHQKGVPKKHRENVYFGKNNQLSQNK